MTHTYHKLFLSWPTLIILYIKLFIDNINIIKNCMRNRIEDDQLNDCLIIYIVKDIFIDIENNKIIQSFHKIKNYLQIFINGIPLFKHPGSVTKTHLSHGSDI